ncbi:DUF5689 domain-containing protein [Winogradskyella endarachnes]|uniref:DUF5689 domain-containing protein n=1 Tax=Winogradskyella endarachnes TaxID=2681965 RepID=A0A6L6UBY7_9FLAO|nr:DUF5689 domain-containing protein [Winogradskyella endarachnes]MUU79861.1 hypothetical protein [Winogradskyella endarachnes]
MNKTSKFLNLIMVLIASIAITSCVQDDDYTIPSSLGDEENSGLEEILTDLSSGDLIEISISDLKALYEAYESGQSGFDYDHFIEISDNLVVKGYVTSSDATGNFYKEFYMQDAPENPTAALGVVLNQVDSYNQFNFGREVYIKLSGMYVGYNANEIITVGGKTDDDEVGQFTANQIPTQIFRSSTTETIVPLEVNLSSISESHVGMFVTSNNVQFPEDLEGSTFGDPTEDFDTQRTLQSCEGFGYSSFLLETSSFANFYNTPLPTGGGSISAVVLKTYGGDNLVYLLNDLNDIQLNDTRCTPDNIDDFNVVFSEDFSAGQGDWEVTNTVGTRDWYSASFDGENYMRATAYSSGGNDDMISWLISPTIDFDAQDDEQLLLQIADAYSNGQPLKAYYSNDYTTGGNPSTATWTEIGATEIEALGENTGFYDNNYESTGLIDLSMVTGDAVIAFVYDSEGGDISTTIDLSDVKILAQ